MAIDVIVGFNPSTTEPLDSRLVAINANDRLSRKDFNCYEGLLIFQQDTNELYACIDPTTPSLEDSWLLVSSGNVSSFFTITNIIKTGSLTIVENNTINKALTVEGGTTLTHDDFTNNALTVEGGTIINNDTSDTSLTINQGGTGNLLIITSESNTPVLINDQGLIILDEFTYTPTPLAGGILYSGSNFYLGIDFP
tara:strand:+ start:1915 stop:2502 length:588 start_codon:yes stop_codon:yes gene_type:complete